MQTHKRRLIHERSKDIKERVIYHGFYWRSKNPAYSFEAIFKISPKEKFVPFERPF